MKNKALAVNVTLRFCQVILNAIDGNKKVQSTQQCPLFILLSKTFSHVWHAVDPVNKLWQASQTNFRQM